MSRARIGTMGIALLTLLAFPREGAANILDLIWEMSGPQMVGVVLLHCKINLLGTPAECRSVDQKLPGVRDSGSDRRLWVSIEGTAYVSTGKDSGPNEYRFGRTYMAAGEATLDVKSGSHGGVRFYHGLAGVSYNFLVGKGFKRFDKVGIKFRPFAVTHPKWGDLAVNVRVHPNGFGDDEFGFVEPRLGQVDRPREVLYGVSWGKTW